jgi:DNA-binding NarL/FixJ family response regulator
MNSALIRIVVCDKEPILSVGLCSLLERRPSVQAVPAMLNIESETGLVPASQSADLAILDPAQFDADPATTARRVKDRFGAHGLIGFCSDMADGMSMSCLRAGFRGLLPKKASLDQLETAITSVAAGSFFIDPIYADVFDSAAAAPPASRTRTLTEREVYVLKSVALGKSLKEIGEELDLSSKTIETYKARGSGKLNLQGRRAIVEYAIRSGWVQ